MIILSLLLLATSLSTKPVWTGQCGSYRLVKWANPSRDKETLFLKDKRGKVVTAISDYHVGPVGDLFSEKPVKTRDINGDGIQDLVLQAWTGGAHGSMTYYFWSLGKSPRCLLAYDKNNGADDRDFRFVDLDRDGVKEIVSWYDGFAYIFGGSYWPDFPVVLHYERGRYVERTARYRSTLAKAEANVWKELKKDIGSVKPGQRSWLAASIVTLLALGDIRGKRDQMWRRLKTAIPAEHYRWFRHKEPQLLAVIRGRGMRYAYPVAYDSRVVRIAPFPTERIASSLEK